MRGRQRIPRRPTLSRLPQAPAAAEDDTHMPPVSAEPRTGRPSQQQAAALTETILDVATDLFLHDGYGSTSIETVAERARISKRTFYHRFRDKAHLFEAVVRRLIDRWRSRLPPSEATLEVPADRLEDALRQMAMQMLEVALSTEALALHRVVLAEAPRFPDLARRLGEYGMGQGVALIGALLGGSAGGGPEVSGDARFAAEHFIHMVVSVPQRRALGFGEPFDRDELERWVRSTVQLFLEGWRHPP
jgi:TetR/AcrR family transcriptional regulator, mexJK operon transcriptional repressor